MKKNELANKISEISKLKGSFVLRSGQTSDQYFDKYRFESRPEILKEVAIKLKDLIPKNIDALAGLELGGVPIATALSLETGIPVVFIRKRAKEYGTRQFAEGLDIKGKNLLIIEDVVTTGGQVKQSAKDLRESGAIVGNILSVIYRGKRGGSPFLDIDLNFFHLFSQEELP